MIIPIQTKLINTDIVCGLVLSQAKSLQFHDVDYSLFFSR